MTDTTLAHPETTIPLRIDLPPQDYRDIAMAAMERGVSVLDLVRTAIMEDLYR